jgi:hypothetical protein
MSDRDEPLCSDACIEVAHGFPVRDLAPQRPAVQREGSAVRCTGLLSFFVLTPRPRG